MFEARTADSPRFAVVGGGWAGCAAAVKLAQAGHSVTLFESSKTLGGRARGVSLDGKMLDNGQHILLGAYRDSLALMRTVGIDVDHALLRLPLQMCYPPGDDGMQFVAPFLPSPLHMLVALMTGDLSPGELACAVNQPLAISDIVLWELALLVQRGRLMMDLDSREFREWLRHLTVLLISLEIARQSTQLDFSSDPADEIIAATSVVENIPLLTPDRRIRKSRIVPLAL